MRVFNSNVLIFEPSIKGHRLEYINHLYCRAVESPEIFFLFALPNNFLEEKHKMNWQDSSNIQFYFLEEVVQQTNSVLLSSFKQGQQLKMLIKQFKINSVFLISLMTFLPVLPFMLSKKVKVSGIIYLIYLYRWSESKWFVKIQDAAKYYLFVKMRVFNTIFILNDPASARYFNIKFKSNKFQYLPDPYVPMPSEKLGNIRAKLNILPQKKVFLHFGGLSRRKGTLDILKAMELLSAVELEKLCFIFAGKVYDDIHEEFYGLLATLKERVQILCFDEFCEYSFLGSLCLSCDYILLPYKETAQSSGMLGFAAQFNKPVIAPHGKLLGKLVEKHGLGFTFKEINIDSLASIIMKVSTDKKSTCSNNYLTTNNVDKFTDIIFSQII